MRTATARQRISIRKSRKKELGVCVDPDRRLERRELRPVEPPMNQTGRHGEPAMSERMLKLRQVEQDIMTTGKVNKAELEILHQALYAHGGIDRQGADFLVELHKRVQHVTPAFEHFFYQTIKEHILAHGRINAEETAWLRRMLFADGRIDDAERKFLHELKGEAKQVSGEFDLLFDDSMKQPPEQHTCG